MVLPPNLMTTPRGSAVLSAMLLFMGSYATHGLNNPGNLLPPKASAVMAIIGYVGGTIFLIIAIILASKARDGVAVWIAFLGIALSGAMAGVVQKQPESFYAVSAGVFSSLILALTALGIGQVPTHAVEAAPRLEDEE